MLDLVYINKPNLFVLIVSCLLKPSHLKTSTLFLFEVIVINNQKGEIERASRPLVISVINDNIDYYD